MAQNRNSGVVERYGTMWVGNTPEEDDWGTFDKGRGIEWDPMDFDPTAHYAYFRSSEQMYCKIYQSRWSLNPRWILTKSRPLNRGYYEPILLHDCETKEQAMSAVEVMYELQDRN